MNPRHLSETAVLACARVLRPAQVTVIAINPNSIPFFMEISLALSLRLAEPDLHEARAIPSGNKQAPLAVRSPVDASTPARK